MGAYSPGIHIVLYMHVSKRSTGVRVVFCIIFRSLLSGLMWFVYDGQFNIRHTCEHGDHLQRYGWIRHDGTSFGQQEIIDNGE